MSMPMTLDILIDAAVLVLAQAKSPYVPGQTQLAERFEANREEIFVEMKRIGITAKLDEWYRVLLLWANDGREPESIVWFLYTQAYGTEICPYQEMAEQMLGIAHKHLPWFIHQVTVYSDLIPLYTLQHDHQLVCQRLDPKESWFWISSSFFNNRRQQLRWDLEDAFPALAVQGAFEHLVIFATQKDLPTESGFIPGASTEKRLAGHLHDQTVPQWEMFQYLTAMEFNELGVMDIMISLSPEQSLQMERLLTTYQPENLQEARMQYPDRAQKLRLIRWINRVRHSGEHDNPLDVLNEYYMSLLE